LPRKGDPVEANMLTADQNESCIDLVQHEDGVLDDWIASLLPEEFADLLERLADLQDGFDVLSVLGW
jgi:hypothetical protein